jgi:hypothetical protein
MMPSPRTLERALETIARRHDVGVDSLDGTAVFRAGDTPAYEMRLLSPFIRGKFQVSEQELALKDAALILDIIDHMVAGTAAEMRGTEILRWLDKGLPIDFFGGLGDEPEHMRAERVATRLAELAELLFKRAERKAK